MNPVVAGFRVDPSGVKSAGESIHSHFSPPPACLRFVNAHWPSSAERAGVCASDSGHQAHVCFADGSRSSGQRASWLRRHRSRAGRSAGGGVRARRRSGIPMYFMGVTKVCRRSAVACSRGRHPGLSIAGSCSPPFGEWSAEANRELIAAVKASGAKLLWLGVSAPKQEIWAYEHLEELGIPIACVGAAVNFNSGLDKRAPHNMQRAGVEWLYRLVREPRRMWRRYLIGNTLFVWDVIRLGKRPSDEENA